jgi:hypothetical protein
MSRGSIGSRLIVAAVLVLAAFAAADALWPGTDAGLPSSARETVAIPESQDPGGTRVIDRVGAEWARRFASNGLADCYRTGEELCERLHCVHVGGYRVPNCRLPTPAYRRTFRGAAVDFLVVRQDEAAARLSNGEMIELRADAGKWRVLALGGGAGRGFFEKPG